MKESTKYLILATAALSPHVSDLVAIVVGTAYVGVALTASMLGE